MLVERVHTHVTCLAVLGQQLIRLEKIDSADLESRRTFSEGDDGTSSRTNRRIRRKPIRLQIIVQDYRSRLLFV